MREQLIGKKDFFRVIISIRVLDTIELAGSLTTCLSLGCREPRVIYSEFMDGFHKLYLATAISTNDSELLEKIEEAFYTNRMDEPWQFGGQIDFRKKSWKFIDLFKEYMLQLKEDGLYNPEITKKINDFEEVWRDSIG